jgi:hypothetical protein
MTGAVDRAAITHKDALSRSTPTTTLRVAAQPGARHSS